MTERQAARAKNRALQDSQKALKVEKALSPAATRFLLIRHGETDWNKEHRLQGQKNPPLNDLGRAQAKAVAARLCSTETWDAIYSSDLERAAQTARSIADTQNTPAAGHKVTAALRERNLGVLEGLTFTEAIRQDPAAWAALCSDNAVSGGESHAEVESRSSRELDHIAEQHPGQTVIIVTHGGVLQVLYKHACGKEYSGRFKNCAINCLWIDHGEWKLGVWGDVSHLEGVGAQTEAFGGGNAG